MTTSILHPNNQRGERVRRAILAVARLAQARDVPLPTVKALSKSLGICVEQTRRHTAKLVHDGVLVVRPAGDLPKRRRVQEIHQ